MTDEPYSVRPFEPGDVEAFLELYREVFDSDAGTDWFDWKYRNNPFVDTATPPILVATRDGTIVGARPFVGLRVLVDGSPVLALQPTDTMVHPDHRRRGVFTRMTRRAIDRYAAAEPALFFNFPNPNSLPGYRKFGWTVVGELPAAYRMQDPGALVRSAFGPTAGPLSSVITAGARGYLGIRERLAPGAASDVSVSRYSTVPAEQLASLYRVHRPAGIHAIRDEAFYRWRFRGAPREYTAYVAARGDTPRGGLVVRRGTHAGAPVATLVDVVPMVPDGQDQDRDRDRDRDRDVFVTLLRAVLDDHRDVAVVRAPGKLLRSALGPFGFHDRQTPLLSRVTRPTVHVVRTLDDGGDPSQTVHGVDVADERNWHLSFAETDYS